MVYLEHPEGRFWRCELTSKKRVTIKYGKCGSTGRTLSKDFETGKDASEYVKKQKAAKCKGGYSNAIDPDCGSKKPSANPRQKRKTETSTPSKKAGLRDHAAPDLDSNEIFEVDSGVAGVDAALASRVEIYDNLHAKLAFVSTSKNQDKYYILQVLVDKNRKRQKGAKRQSKQRAQYYLFTRWGRTGTGGQAKLEGPWNDDEEIAVERFAKAFKAKTGVEWSKAIPGAPPKSNKYEFLTISRMTGSMGHWFYFLQNDPLGKPDRWYSYDENNGAEAEEIYREYVSSNHSVRLSTRLVCSETSGFTYKVDLQAMTQTNNQSGTTRPIARSTVGKAPTNLPTDRTKSTPGKTTPGFVQSTPARVISAMAPKTKSKPMAARSLAASVSVSAGNVDSAAPLILQKGSVYCEYDAMLNQTNLGSNNNKFYKIQLIETSTGVHLFTKWGRVGEAGTTQLVGPMDSERAVNEFEKKFWSKTGNEWNDRDDFEPVHGKYALVEMENDSRTTVATKTRNSHPLRSTLPCKLDTKTKGLVDLIFDEDMFKSAMSEMKLDPVRLPLGALSQAQIARGFEALEKLEEEVNGAASSKTLMELTSNFYTIIPHAFGRSRGPVLNTKESVAEKYDMLNTLSDIETAQTMQSRKGEHTGSDEAVTHPSDLNYQQLAADLTLVGDDDKDRSIIEQYLRNTMGGGTYHGSLRLRDVWRVDRHHESERFAKHKDLCNRKLLWHGTNVAAVAAILKNGLRIMPHSGGRVGRGIYLADLHEKSAYYVSPAQGTYVMFLVEAALGKQCEITMDDSSLVSAPKGFDSVLAKGTKVPKEETDMDIDGNIVKVPSGKPVTVKMSGGSSFAHNEFLIYKESQHRIRYVLWFDC